MGYECCSYNILQALGLITCLMTFVFVGIWDRKLTVCWGFSFPTCQVRVVRFYVGCPAASFSSSSAGPQLQALDRSIPRRTRTASTGSECSPTASSGSKCSPPDLNRELRIRVFPAGPQPQRISEDIPNRMPERMSEYMPEGMSE